MNLIAGSDEFGSGVSKGPDMVFYDVLERVFKDTGQIKTPTKLSEVENYVHHVMDRVASDVRRCNQDYAPPGHGRIGPKRVMFDISTNVGSFIVDKDRLGVSSQSNFSTIRANTCVFEGRWQYELLLGSKGVMQLGWTSLDGTFSQEKGVGDTADSYAYDGNRIRKWNVATNAYGEPWLTGDVIGCAIDCDKNSICFYRNGRYMGEAFNDVRTGPGLAYFPAVSLAYSENLVANFGATPLKHPVPDHRPLQDPPEVDVAKTKRCLSWLQRILDMYPSEVMPRRDHASFSQKTALMITASHVFQHLGPLLTSSYAVEAQVIPFLMRLGLGENLAESKQPPAFADHRAYSSKSVETFLTLLWTLAEEREIRTFLENLAVGVLTCYRFAPVGSDYALQKNCLRFLIVILAHQRTRHFLLQNVFFDKIKFPVFLHVKPPDDEGLCQMIPNVWWEDEQTFDLTSEDGGPRDNVDGTADLEPKTDTVPVVTTKQNYLEAVIRLKKKVEEVEQLQVRLLLLLMKDDDATDRSLSSRSYFRVKLREFLKENMLGTRIHPVHLCPLPVTLCFFHCLVRALRLTWDKQDDASCWQAFLTFWSDGARRSSEGHSRLASTRNGRNTDCLPPASVPVAAFVNGSIDYFESQNVEEGNPVMGQLEVRRLGGLASHLRKTYPNECGQTSEYSSCRSASGSVFVSTKERDGGMLLPTTSLPTVGASPTVRVPSYLAAQSAPDNSTLVEILDGTVLLYHIAAHKQLGKMCSLRDSMQEYVTALNETNQKLFRLKNKPEYELVKSALMQNKLVFSKKLQEQGRHIAWLQAVVYSTDKQQDVDWLLKVLIRTLDEATHCGNLFSFVPDFYVDACINSCVALENFFTPAVQDVDDSDFSQTLINVALFLAQHFVNPRIVSADVKDNLVQALANFVCKSSTLSALEAIPSSCRILLVKKLLHPYENRAWAQSNWILVRFWKGCGFAFRYNQPPHLSMKMGPKLRHLETSLPNQFQQPCPSVLYQQHVAYVMLHDNEGATAFLNSVLNQLNWAFSEFVGMLQEIQNASNSVERVFVDSRQLKICSTCFDLAVALLRVLEMVVHVAPALFTDCGRSSAEPLLARLCQLLCQVLNRVTSRSGCFDLVVDLEIPGLESIDHFPIVTAVIGILIQLLVEGETASRECATQALLAEPSFQLSSLDFVLTLDKGKESRFPRSTVTPLSAPSSPALRSSTHSKLGSDYPTQVKRPFSLKNYAEVSTDEISLVERLLQYIWTQEAKVAAETKVTAEDDLCPICYAHVISAIFRPCGHKSCRACISHQLLNKSECFFCKSNIEMVVTADGGILHDLCRKQTTV